MPTVTRPLPAVHGRCRWIFGAPTVADLDEGRVALEITVETNKGEVTTYYLVRALRDARSKLLGYRLTKDEDGELTDTYDIDTSFGPLPEYWTCECADATYKPHRPGGCKHKKSLAEALKRVRS